jgi:CubicO group peptidase (beta-lactamase class C family)
MTDLAKRLDWIPARLDELLQRYRIPGVALGIFYDGEIFSTARGMANLRAGIEATPDSVFLIGSITKVFTTTLVMQLVELGEVELNAPVHTYVPELKLSDAEATQSVTVRHLLTHTSGITGDYFPDFGRGDDAVANLVASFDSVEMLCRPGRMFSYCNSGFILAGRLIERVTGQTWDRVLRERLLNPLGADSFCTLPEEALLHRVGVGHVPDPESGQLRPGQMWPEVRSGGPAGFTPFATVTDLLTFARLHLDGGVTQTGKRLLSEESVAAMQAQHVESNPSGAYEGNGWGMGWARYRYGDNEPVIGHNGGAAAVLRVLPERNFAIASLTNAPMGMFVGQRIIDAIVSELFGLSIPEAPASGYSLPDLKRYEGSYRHHTYRQHVTIADGQLVTRTEGRATPPTVLKPLDSTTFTTHAPASDIPYKAAFLELDEVGRPGYFHIGGRAFLRDA